MKRTRATLRGSRLGGSILVVFAVFMLGVAAGNLAQFDTGEQARNTFGEVDGAFDPFWDAFAIIGSSYIDQVDADVLIDGAIEGMADALGDAHSGYIRPDRCPVISDFSGEFSGIGVIIEAHEATGQIVVVNVIPNSPAEQVGVLPGDVFHELDGILVAGLSLAELSAMAPGPRGTSVTATFRRAGQLVTYEIIRDVFPVPNVTYKMVGDNIAHITMLDFNDLSRSQLADALDAIDINSTRGLIFDIRNNPGGTLASAIEIGSAFIEDGVLLRQVSRDLSEEVTRASGGYAGIEAPIVVLVDETSASASEVIAGAMQDHGVATILGETTFGKGTVQNLPELSNGGCLRLTVRRWLTPNGHWIHKQGIKPDIVVEWDPDRGEPDADDDPQLAAAIDYLQSLRD